MDPELELLLPLLPLDRRGATLRDTARRARQRLEAAARAVDEATARAQALQDTATRQRDEEKAHARELTRLEGLLASARNALAHGHGDAAGAERQIDKCTTLIDEHETAQLELMEAQEATSAQLDEATIALEAAQAEHAEVQDTQGAILADARAGLAEVAAARDAQRARLTEDLREHYDALISRRGVALATVDDDHACTVCRHVVAYMQRGEIKDGHRVFCSGCGCWLVTAAPADPA